MMRTIRFAVHTSVFVVLFSLAAVAHTQSPFDGTWRIDPAKAKFDQKPFTLYTSQGWYHCVSCTPPFDVQADGQFHAVAGQPFDTASVTIIDAHTIRVVTMKGDKPIEDDTATVSADGKMTTIKTVTYPPNGSGPQDSSMTLKRVGVLPAGVHATSGNWVPLKIADTEADLTFTFQSNGDELTMTDPTGDSYTAKFDGADYPYKGGYYTNAVSLKRVDAHTIVETDKRDGKVLNEQKMTVSADGKTMTIVAHSPMNDMTSTFIAMKK